VVTDVPVAEEEGRRLLPTGYHVGGRVLHAAAGLEVAAGNLV